MIFSLLKELFKNNPKCLRTFNYPKNAAMKLLLLSYIVLFFGVCTGFSQETNNRVSKKRFQERIDEISTLQSSNKDSVLDLVANMMKIAHSLHDEKLLASALITKATIESEFINQDQAILTIMKALKINERLNNTSGIGEIYANLGSFNYRKSNFVEATKNCLKAIEITKKRDSATIIFAYRRLSDINIKQHNFQDALKYALLAKAFVTKNTPENTIAKNALATGNAYRELNDFPKAESQYNEATRLFKKNNNGFYLAFTYYEQAKLYYENDLLKSVDFRLKAQNIFDKIAPSRLTSASNMGFLGKLYVMVAINDSLLREARNPLIPKTKPELLQKAELLYNKALTIFIEKNSTLGMLSVTEFLAHVQALSGNHKDAFTNLLASKKMRDSLFSQENKNEIAKLMSEKEVFQLKSENEKKASINKILVVSAITLLLLGFLGYRNLIHKRKVQNLKISELEKDKQLLTVDAMLKGQEEERSRIAKDLHDGLGGMLSGTKLSFIHMKENLILTPENATQFDKSLDMLDNTITDLRKVAQNLMPEALLKFGLIEALRDFCNIIQSSSKVTVDFQKLGLNRKLGNTAEIFVYRIIQELVNNAIKHARATEIIVQIAISENKTSITVEDNGIGYDKSTINTKIASGLENIDYRVHYLNGVIDTQTSLNNGTSVNIELHV